MGHKNKIKNFAEHLEMLLEDCPDLIHLLANYNYFEDAQVLEIMATLPSAVDVDVSIATVKRWRELQSRYKKPLRVYAYSYNIAVEKLFMRLVQEYDDILLTIIPGEWKGRIDHA